LAEHLGDGPLVVRPAAPQEAPAVVALYDWLFAAPGSQPPRWDVETATERLAAVASADASVVLVASSADRLVGFCTAYLDLVSVRFGPRCWVEDLAVAPDERSRGAGSSLLGAAMSWAAERGASHLELDSGMARTDAHRFYERHAPAGRSLCFSWDLG
jgi:GNAT superfamily N-acetyltransferase